MRKLLAALSLIALVGCSESETSRPTEADPNPQIDADPTPQTGSGGDSQTATPDTTVNGSPGAKPLANQPTPTDN